MNSNDQTRTYIRSESVVFLKTKEAFGGLSNMAGGYPLCVNGIGIRTSEALYQACRFPRLPEVQKLIIDQKSPMTAKMKSKPHRDNTRKDWSKVQVKIMRWCLQVKLAQNWNKFGKLLLETENRSIVEQARRDSFWGAKPVDDETLVGMNVLGRLLMELRETVKHEPEETLLQVLPLNIPNFEIAGSPIEIVTGPGIEAVSSNSKSSQEVDAGTGVQTLLVFDELEKSEIAPVVISAQSSSSTKPNSDPSSKRQYSDINSVIQPVPPSSNDRENDSNLNQLSHIMDTFNERFGFIPWEDVELVRKLITEDIPALVVTDPAFKMAREGSDKSHARIEHNKALVRAMKAVVKDNTEIYKQFMDNEDFKHWVMDTVFDLVSSN